MLPEGVIYPGFGLVNLKLGQSRLKHDLTLRQLLATAGIMLRVEGHYFCDMLRHGCWLYMTWL
jgi:hypothetical protein